ncbi:MAG TPA: Flp family type IVb pilin [Syntrophales bacterium]|jgi:pilus assembly protein Flp/PilA|nr:Flp family type IVb pilin [Syntrophales bacterium]HOX93678.1 Flp family type IVb pilin [Syntrophales bacterium]HPI56584.1 Flp family type IVb pilin [Syntrophales bacterium]HPN24995.1 Flp family type IVb pilin [Syntrophales bacterium]HQM29263.1 Flp family type IVb pilin [Syntrophales bacterium]
MQRIKQFLKDEEGVTAIEYALIAAGIAMAIAIVVWLVGDRLYDVFDRVQQMVGPDRPSGT